MGLGRVDLPLGGVPHKLVERPTLRHGVVRWPITVLAPRTERGRTKATLVVALHFEERNANLRVGWGRV